LNKRKLLQKLLASPSNTRFDAVRGLVEAFGFNLMRISGSHYVFKHPAIPDLLNLQEADGEAKPYQVRQFLRLIEQYHLMLEDTK